MDSQHHLHDEQPSGGIPAGKIALVAFLAVALFFLVTQHRAHLYGALPYLLVLACPLMHFFHHRGHGRHHGHGGNGGSRQSPGIDGEKQ